MLAALSPRFMPVLLIRVARYCYLCKYLKIISSALTWLNTIVFGIEFTAKCEVGEGLLLPHTFGTVVGARVIGANATIFQGVTLGAKFADLAYDASSRPVIGDNVLLGAGAKVLGGILVGDNVTVAANTLVVTDVEPDSFVIGVPGVATSKRT